MRGKSNRLLFMRQIVAAAAVILCTVAFGTTLSFGAAEQQDADAVFARLQAGERVLQERQYTEPTDKTVYLTFDDGPSEFTPQVLDLLKQEDVKATFFVLGMQAEKRPELIKRIVQEGHALGNHTYNHSYDELYSSFDSFWQQIQQSEKILEDIAGVRPTAVRAPGGSYGHFDSFYYYYMDLAGYRIFDWNVDSGDARQRNVPAATIVSNVKSSRLLHEVHVLTHDSAGHAETVRALPEIIAYYKELGYQFAVYDERVQPVMFSAGKPRHQRDNSRTQYDRFTGLIQEYLSAEQLRVAEKIVAMPLKVMPLEEERQGHGAANLVPQAEESAARAVSGIGSYVLNNEALSIPLRQLAAQVGAEIVWDKQLRAGVIRLEDISYSFLSQERQVRIERADGTVEQIAMKEMTLKNGIIQVPLRAAALFAQKHKTTFAAKWEQEKEQLLLAAANQEREQAAGWSRGWAVVRQAAVLFARTGLLIKPSYLTFMPKLLATPDN